MTESDHITLPLQQNGDTMSLRTQLDSRHSLLGDANVTVKEAARKGTTLWVNGEAQRLLHDYPNCPMSLARLQEKIIRLAVRNRVPMCTSADGRFVKSTIVDPGQQE